MIKEKSTSLVLHQELQERRHRLIPPVLDFFHVLQVKHFALQFSQSRSQVVRAFKMINIPNKLYSGCWIGITSCNHGLQGI